MKKVSVQHILFLLTLLLLAFLLLTRYQLTMIRYFDVDEFAHLKWAQLVSVGARPYVDFLSFFPPGFHWFLAPLFWWGDGIQPIVWGRLGQFGIFGGITLATMWLFWEMRRSWVAIVAGLVLVFLPIPADKFVEIRPDNLATLLFLVGAIGELRAMREVGVLRARWWLISGLCFALSMIVLTKMVPVVGVAVVVGGSRYLKSPRLLRSLMVGMGIPLLLFGLWMVSLGDLSTVVYSLTKLPLEANKISQWFGMRADHFFYPNDIFYGCWGWCSGLVANHVLWAIGLVIGVVRGFGPKFGQKQEARSEFLVAWVFLIQVILFVQFVPLKHTQYLVPIAPFVAFYVADVGLEVWKSVQGRKLAMVVFAIGYLGSLGYLYNINGVVNKPKLGWTNKDMLASVEKLQNIIPKGSYVLDFDGRTLYYPSPYYVCCLPWGQYKEQLSKPLPPLIDALEKTKARYIYQGQLSRINTLPVEEQAYIISHYEPYPGDATLLVRKD